MSEPRPSIFSQSGRWPRLVQCQFVWLFVWAIVGLIGCSKPSTNQPSPAPKADPSPTTPTPILDSVTPTPVPANTTPEGSSVPPVPAKPLSDKELYVAHCATCHGDKGAGDGIAARFLYPKPRNFGEGKFRIVSTANSRPTDQDLMNVITHGMPGSAMIPFGHLSEGDRKKLVTYVRQLTREGYVQRLRKQLEDQGEDVDDAELAKKADTLLKVGDPFPMPAQFPASDKDSIARGDKIYQTACASCHGKTGKGDGGQEQRDEDGTPTKPRDLTRGIFKGGRDQQQLYARVMLGMPGSPMPSHLLAMKPNEAGDVINFMLSLSDISAQAKVEHKRTQFSAKRAPGMLGAEITDSVWEKVPSTAIVTSPLWWREYSDPALQVSAVHDGQSLVVRLTWLDSSQNGVVTRPEDFEDMAALQLYKGNTEPFLGMGSEAGKIDLWHWRAGGGRSPTFVNSKLDDYPHDAPQYKDIYRDKTKPPVDQYTARAAGNPLAQHETGNSASSMTAKGIGSTTMRPKESQKVIAKADWKDGRWTVILRRPLSVGPGDGISLSPGDRVSIAFAMWDGAARDRNGQKLVSIWHDLTLE